MNENIRRDPPFRAVLRWMVAAAFIVAVAASGLFAGMTNRAGLFFLLLGTSASILMGFSRTEIAAAFRHGAGRPGEPEDLKRSAIFWESAARNAWILGVLGSVLNFTLVLGGGSEGIADISDRMIQSFVVTLYGLILAVVFMVPAMKLSGRAGKAGLSAEPEKSGRRSLVFERVTGYALFAVVFGLVVFSLIKNFPPGGPLPATRYMLHPPAALVVFGGAIALALFLGTGAGARALTFGFGMTGLVALLMGLIQAMFGFVHTSISEVATAIAFIISSSLYTLLGLALIAAPIEDRTMMKDPRGNPGRISRMLWVLYPLLAFFFLILTWIMVIIPMRRPG